MSIDFKIKDFFYPLPILSLRAFLEKSQWLSREELEAFQLKRLKMILRHSYENIPYYRDLFDRLKLVPGDFESLDDLKKIPPLDKEILRKNFKLLTATNAKKFNPYLYRTSGTSGEPLEFNLDRSSNILEFCYYWRYWSWAGYRLGSSFAEFSLHRFLNANVEDISQYSRPFNRLVLNPSQISYENIDKFVKEIKKHRPLFLKGAPSTLYIFSLLLEKRGYDSLSFKAVFTTGEVLLPFQREKIEKVLHCKILDSYGHMERTVAISQCPLGSYHIHPEYGILEVDKNKGLSSGKKEIGRIIGTSLHNFAMPLLRYRVDDLIEIDPHHQRCECGRALPLVEKIHGRGQDIIITKEGKFVTNIFIFFEFWEGISWHQLIQEDIDKFRLNLLKDTNFNEKSIAEKMKGLRSILGKDASIDLKFLKLEEINLGDVKYRPVVSKINIEKYI